MPDSVERSVRDGAWLTYVVALVIAGYALATSDQPRRTTIVLVLAVAVFGGYVMSRLPVAALMRSRWREPFFLVWTALDLALIALVVASDSSDWSPLRATFFLPLFFAALSYPPRSVAATGVLSVLGYLGAALLGGHATAETLGHLLRDPGSRDGDQHLPRRQPRAPARRAADALALGPARRRPDPPRLHRALRGRALRPRPPRQPPARPDHRRASTTFKAVERRPAARRRRRAPVSVAVALAADLHPCNIGRLGGDEFAVLLPQAGPGELRAAAMRLEQRLRTVTAASISLAALPVDGLCAEDLHRAADATSAAPAADGGARRRRGCRLSQAPRAPARSPCAAPRRCPRRW